MMWVTPRSVSHFELLPVSIVLHVNETLKCSEGIHAQTGQKKRLDAFWYITCVCIYQECECKSGYNTFCYLSPASKASYRF